MDYIAQFTARIQNSPFLAGLLNVVWILLLALAVYFLVKSFLVRGVLKLLGKASPRLKDSVLKSRMLNRLSFLAPAIIIYNFAYLLPGSNELIQRIVSGLIILFLMLVIGSVLNLFNDYYAGLDLSHQVPIKSYLQILKMMVYVLGGLLITAVLFDKSPLVFLSGIGALTAVLLLIFKDTILSFVASIQINSNDLVNVGDWIEVPAFGADGDVIDIALHQIQIQNWDKTISTIPTYKLLDATFKNWRGMAESGGRRIKREILIDAGSVQFLTEKQIEHLKEISVLGEYIRNKQLELDRHNKKIIKPELQINGRYLTNIGTFRQYMEEYLRHHPGINQEMTLMVRQLKVTSKGIPLQIYCFTGTIEWIPYEKIQSDIFDHVLAVIPEFGLRIYQEPSGSDIKMINPA